MGKVEDALRDLIQYHGKRVAGQLLGDVPSELREARREIRALAKAVETLTKQVQTLSEARLRQMAVPPAPKEQARKMRFTKRTLKSLRRRFGLTQQELAGLLEVSPVTVTAWETGKSRPRERNLAKIATLRAMDQGEVDEALGREPAPSSVTPAQLKRLRSKFSLTQAELAELVGVSTASVTSWEGGKTPPSRENRGAIDQISQLSPQQLDARLGREGAPARGAASGTGEGPSPDEIRAIREGAGMSQREVAEKLGVSANTVSNWETGRTVPRRASAAALMAMKAGG
ncbi:MAG: helix-turn-helix domain-containing protein [Planctomycetota bacterium]|jgi:DNA-binding transcriptional regulator YiaG